MFHCLALSDQIHLVLEDDNVVRIDANNLQCRKMLAGLWLGAGLVAGDEEESAVHLGMSEGK